MDGDDRSNHPPPKHLMIFPAPRTLKVPEFPERAGIYGTIVTLHAIDLACYGQTHDLTGVLHVDVHRRDVSPDNAGRGRSPGWHWTEPMCLEGLRLAALFSMAYQYGGPFKP